jgi:osmotically-inducible protein OsmY
MAFRDRESMAAGMALALLAGIGIGAYLARLAGPRDVVEQSLSGIDDALLRERVRRAMATALGDPSGVHVRVRDGRVVLRGPARAGLIEEIVACATRVPGVRAVENRLSPNG